MEKGQLIEEIQITNNLKHTTYVAYDESKIFLEVNFMDGKYIIQKTFKNNYIELETYEKVRKDLDSDERIIEYLNLDKENKCKQETLKS